MPDDTDAPTTTGKGAKMDKALAVSTVAVPGKPASVALPEPEINLPSHITAPPEAEGVRPNWSNYKDPEAAANADAAMRRVEDDIKQSEIAGEPEYMFFGHAQKGNETRTVITRYGTVELGGKIRLPADELAKMRAHGFIFNEVRG